MEQEDTKEITITLNGTTYNLTQEEDTVFVEYKPSWSSIRLGRKARLTPHTELTEELATKICERLQ